MKYFTLLTLWFSCVLSAQLKPYYQQKASYKMDIQVDAKNFTYDGKQSITYTNNSPDELKEVYFNLFWNAFRPNSMMDQRVSSQGKDGDGRLQKDGISRLASIPKDQEGSQIIKVLKQNGKDVKIDIQETIMKVTLAEPIAPGSSTQFYMEWSANIPMQIRRAGRNNREGIDMTMTQWYPKITEYDYDGWAAFDYIGREFHAPFSDFDVKISIDKDYIIGAGGSLQNPNDVKGYTPSAKIKTDKNGKATWHWKAENILDFAWAADRDYQVESFDVLNGPKVFLVYQQNEKTKYWKEAVPYIREFFSLMNNRFGEYPYPTYSFIQGGDGGMEYGRCTMILGEAEDLEGLCGLMFHEAGHSWYQQVLATNEAMYPWMDEGFTSYAEDWVMYMLFKKQDKMPNPFVNSIANYQNFIKTGKEESASWLADHHKGGKPYTFASYVKGELFLVNLGYIVGEKTLQEIMKEYFSTWKLKHPAPRDFMHIAQKASDMDLKWYYHYWINTTETIDYGIKNITETPTGLQITLENKGGIPMPIDFSVVTQDGKLVNYYIPTTLTRNNKQEDIFGGFQTQKAWAWTQKEYLLNLPYKKSNLKVVGIDFSQRMADINWDNNYQEIK